MYRIAFCEEGTVRLVMSTDHLNELDRFSKMFDSPNHFVNFTKLRHRPVQEEWILVGVFDIYEAMSYVPFAVHIIACVGTAETPLPSLKEIDKILCGKKKFQYAEVRLIPIKVTDELGKTQSKISRGRHSLH